MGLFSKPTAAAPLAPVPAPIGVIPHYTQHGQQIALKVRERKVSISGDDFAVKDAVTGQTMFRVEGKVFSLSDKKIVKDANGTPLFTIRKKHLAIKTTYQGLDSKSNNVIFTVQSALFALGTKLTATFNNAAGSGQEVTLHLKGDLVSCLFCLYKLLLSYSLYMFGLFSLIEKQRLRRLMVFLLQESHALFSTQEKSSLINKLMLLPLHLEWMQLYSLPFAYVWMKRQTKRIDQMESRLVKL